MEEIKKLLNQLSSASTNGTIAPGDTEYIKALTSLVGKVKRLGNQNVGVNIKFEITGVDQAISEIDKLKTKISELKTEATGKSKVFGRAQVVDTSTKAYDNIINKKGATILDKVTAFNNKYNGADLSDPEIGNIMRQDQSMIRSSLITWWSGNIAKIKTNLGKLDTEQTKSEYDKFKSDIADMHSRYQSLLNSSVTGKYEKIDYYAIQQFENLYVSMVNMSNQIGAAVKNVPKERTVNQQQISRLLESVANYGVNNSKIKTNAETNSIYTTLYKQVSAASQDASKITAKDFDNLKKQFSELKAMAADKGLVGKSWGDAFKGSLFEGLTRASSYISLYRIVMLLRQAYQTVYQIDQSMTDLKRVTSETATEYNRFLDEAGDRAVKLGTTINEIVSATTTFARLGYDLGDASKLADVAILYRNVGDLDIKNATDNIVANLKAFNIAADGAEHVVDVFDILGNKYATTAAQVGDGLVRSASALNTAGNSFEQSAAMVTAVTEITQDSKSAGLALRTLALRLRSTKTELAEMGEESEGAAETSSKLQKQLKALTGVDIMLNAKEYKSTYQIMEEIAGVWHRLTDSQKAATLELIAGKTRANQVAALLNNWSQAENALYDSLNSAGTATRENEKYLDSMAGKTQQLKASFEGLSLDVINSESAKDVISILTEFVNLIDAGADTFQEFTIPIAIAVKDIFKLVKACDEADIGLGKLINAFSRSATAERNMAIATVEGATSLEDLTEEQILAAQQAEATNAAMGALVTTLATFAITGAIALISKIVHDQKELKENAIATAEALNDETNTVERNSAKIVELQQKLQSSNLSQEEYNHLKEQLVEIEDDLKDKFGEEASQIDLVNGKYEDQIQLIDELSHKKAQKTLVVNNPEISKAILDFQNDTNVIGKGAAGYLYYKPTNPETLSKVSSIYNQYGWNVGETPDIESVSEYLDTIEKIQSDLIEEFGTSNEEVNKLIQNLQTYIDEITSPSGLGNAWQGQGENITLIKENAQVAINASEDALKYQEELKGINTELQEALDSGDLEQIKSAYQKRQEVLSQIDELIQSSDFYIDNKYSPLFSKEVGYQIKKNAGTGEGLPISESDLEYLLNIYEQYPKLFGDAYKYLDKFQFLPEKAIEILKLLGIIEDTAAGVTKKASAAVTGFNEIYKNSENQIKGIDAYSKAISSLQAGDTIDLEGIDSLLAIDPTLVSKVQHTAEGYKIELDDIIKSRNDYVDKLRKSYEDEIKANQSKIDDLQKIVDSDDASFIDKSNALDNITKLKQESEGYALILEQLVAPAKTFDDIVADTATKVKDLKSLFDSMLKDVKETGHISLDNVISFVDKVENWQDYLVVNNGKFSFAEGFSDSYKELIKESSGYNAQLQSMKTELDDLIERRSKLYSKLYSSGNPAIATEIDTVTKEIDESKDKLSEYTALWEAFFAVLSKGEEETVVDKLNKKIKDLDHQLAMGIISQTNYNSEYAKAVAEAKAQYEGSDPQAFYEFDEAIHTAQINKTNKEYERALKDLQVLHDDEIVIGEDFINRKKALVEKYYGPGTLLGSTEEGQDTYKDLQREIIEDEISERKRLYDKALKQIDHDTEMGLIKPTEKWKRYQEAADKYLKGIPQLADDYKEAMKDINTTGPKEMYDEDRKQVDRLFADGKISLSTYLEECESLWRKYYHNKKQFADEDYETLKQLEDDYKNGIQTQIDALGQYADLTVRDLTDQKEALEEMQKEEDKAYDKKIKKLQREKKEIEERNKKEKKQLELLEKENALKEASMNNRLVYTGAGGYEIKRDEQAYQKAYNDYLEKKAEDEASKKDEEIQALQDQKDAYDEAIEDQIDAIDKQTKEIRRPLDDLIKILTTMLAVETSGYDEEFIQQLLNSESGQEAIERINEYYGYKNAANAKYGAKSSDKKSTTETERQKSQREAGLVQTIEQTDTEESKKKKKYTFDISDTKKTASDAANKYHKTPEEYLKSIGFDVGDSDAKKSKSKSKSETKPTPQQAELMKKIDSVSQKPIIVDGKVVKPDKVSTLGGMANVNAMPMIGQTSFNITVNGDVNDKVIDTMRDEATNMFNDFIDIVSSKMTTSFMKASSVT